MQAAAAVAAAGSSTLMSCLGSSSSSSCGSSSCAWQRCALQQQQLKARLHVMQQQHCQRTPQLLATPLQVQLLLIGQAAHPSSSSSSSSSTCQAFLRTGHPSACIRPSPLLQMLLHCHWLAAASQQQPQQLLACLCSLRSPLCIL
jgi:hypothetical protein